MEEEEAEDEQHVCTSYPAIPSISIAVDETNVLPGALQLIRKLRPQWETARVKTKVQPQRRVSLQAVASTSLALAGWEAGLGACMKSKEMHWKKQGRREGG